MDQAILPDSSFLNVKQFNYYMIQNVDFDGGDDKYHEWDNAENLEKAIILAKAWINADQNKCACYVKGHNKIYYKHLPKVKGFDYSDDCILILFGQQI